MNTPLLNVAPFTVVPFAGAVRGEFVTLLANLPLSA